MSPATAEESSPSAAALPALGHPPSLERVGPARQDFGTQQASAPVWFTAYAEQQQAQLTLLRERAEQAELRQAELSRTVLLLSQTLDGMAATQRVPPALPLAPSMPEGKHGVHYAQAAVPRKQETRKGIHPSFKTEPPRESRGATSFGVTRGVPSYGGDHRYMGPPGATHVTLAAAGHFSGSARGRGGPGDEDPDPFTAYVHQEDSSDDDSRGRGGYTREPSYRSGGARTRGRVYVPKYRGDDVSKMRKHPLLVDRSDPVRWLINFRAFCEEERWDRDTRKHMLPQLWKDDKPASRSSNWAAEVRKALSVRHVSEIQLEKHFLARNARQGELDQARIRILTCLQPAEALSGDWVRALFHEYSELKRWSAKPTDLPSEEDLVASLRTRLTTPLLVRHLHMHGMPPSYVGLLGLCDSIDDGITANKNVQARLEEVNAKKAKVAMVGLSGDRIYVLQAEAQSELLLYQEVAQALVRQDGGEPSLGRVNRIVQNMKSYAKEVIPAERMTEWGKVFGSRHKPSRDEHGTPKAEGCPFHMNKRDGCNRGEGECPMPHIRRKNAPCPSGSANSDSCPLGAFCPLVHKDHMYPIIFRNKNNPNEYLKIFFKDDISPFSPHYRQ